MCRPERPSADAYNDKFNVAPHFSITPVLTPIPTDHHYRSEEPSIWSEVRNGLKQIYREHGLIICHQHGLYYTGSAAQNDNLDNEHTMLLVVELLREEIGEWWKMDGDIRELLEMHDLSGLHGVCIRYYEAGSSGQHTERGDRFRAAQSTYRARRYARGQLYGSSSPITRPSSTSNQHVIPSYRPNGLSYIAGSSPERYRPTSPDVTNYAPVSPDLTGLLLDESSAHSLEEGYRAALTLSRMSRNEIHTRPASAGSSGYYPSDSSDRSPDVNHLFRLR